MVNYRSKTTRAEKVVAAIAASGGIGIALQADLTVESEVAAMMGVIRERFFAFWTWWC